MAEPGPATTVRRAKEARSVCAVCGKEFPRNHMVALAMVRPAIVERMRRTRSELPVDGFVCGADVARYRAEYVSDMLRSERGELSELEEDVVRSLSAGETLSENVEASYSEKWTFGEQIADRVATFGGSWTFILTFLGHEKMDHLINRQWEQLAEIQEIQLEMMQDAVNRRPR